MDTALTSKPPAAVAHAAFVRPDALPVREAVATELAAPKAVTAATDAAPANTASKQPQAYTREITIDPQSREVIFRVIDVRSRQVVRQVPDQALLRMRAYTRALDDGKTPTEALNMADRRA
ncbi:MAG: hypothetical protein JWN71_3043 [Xanthobacteraceae bacterium]|jgi:hypothetical protein|nr:hypothetical protein [Xanthobacteraceae bacterium]